MGIFKILKEPICIDSLEECPKIKPMPDEGERVLALYRGEWIVLEVAIEYPTFEETFRPFKYWREPFSDMLQIEYYDVDDWLPLPEIPSNDDWKSYLRISKFKDEYIQMYSWWLGS